MRATTVVVGSGLCCLHLRALQGDDGRGEPASCGGVPGSPGVAGQEPLALCKGDGGPAPATLLPPRAHPPARSLPHKMHCLVQPGS